jgi:hypothetical protein
MAWHARFQDTESVKRFMRAVFSELREEFRYRDVELEGTGDDYDENVRVFWEEKMGALSYYWEIYDPEYDEREAGLSVLCHYPDLRHRRYRFQLEGNVILDPVDFESETTFFGYFVSKCLAVLYRAAERNFPDVRPRPLKGEKLEEVLELFKSMKKLRYLPGDHVKDMEWLRKELNHILIDEKGLRYYAGESAPLELRKYVESLRQYFVRPEEDAPSHVARHGGPRRAKDLPVMRGRFRI